MTAPPVAGISAVDSTGRELCTGILGGGHDRTTTMACSGGGTDFRGCFAVQRGRSGARQSETETAAEGRAIARGAGATACCAAAATGGTARRARTGLSRPAAGHACATAGRAQRRAEAGTCGPGTATAYATSRHSRATAAGPTSGHRHAAVTTA